MCSSPNNPCSEINTLIILLITKIPSLQKAAVAAFAWSGESNVNSTNLATNNNNNSNNNNNTIEATNTTPVPGNSPVPTTASTTTCSATGLPTMPVGGVQSQNPTQGLVHWMSAVMAEHMTSNSHHDPTVGMHYMWNGGVDVSIEHVIYLISL